MPWPFSTDSSRSGARCVCLSEQKSDKERDAAPRVEALHRRKELRASLEISAVLCTYNCIEKEDHLLVSARLEVMDISHPYPTSRIVITSVAPNS